MESSIRLNGVKKLVTGAFAGVAAAYFVYWLQLQGYSPSGIALIGLAAPAAWGFVGLLEMLMNRPFTDMEVWWNSLHGWQRGVLGVFVVIMAFTLMIASIGLAGYMELI